MDLVDGCPHRRICIPGLVGHNLLGHMPASGPTDLPPAVAVDPSGTPQITAPFGRRAVGTLAQQGGVVPAVGVRRLPAFHVPGWVPEPLGLIIEKKL